MIHESQYWKDDLLRAARLLRFRLVQKRWYPSTFASVERTVMLGFYAVRKLIEATKVDGRIARQTAKVTTYPSTGKRVVRTNWTHYWELYDLESPTSAKLPLILLCHQFVHSYVFSCEFSERKEFESVCVSSDRERNRLLYSVSVPEVIRLFEAVGNSYPNDIRMRFNVKKGDYDVVSRTSKVAHLSHD